MKPPSKKMSLNFLDSQAKEMLCSVNKFFLEEKANKGPIIEPSRSNERTCKATNLSISTVKRICAKYNKVRHTPEELPEPEFLPPKKKKRPRTVTNLDVFAKSMLRKTILSFYERREIPTVEKIKKALKENESYNYIGSITSLRRILKQIGFKFTRVDGRKVLLERSDVAAARSRFLREMRQLAQSHDNFVHLDEAWVNLSSTDATRGISKPRTGKGSGLIVLHAGTKDGFVDKCSLVLQCKNDGDYGKQINAEVFEDWFRNQLLPNIAQNSVIIMDNASYHCRLLEEEPKVSWQKSEIQEWLIQKEVHTSENLSKAELLEYTKNLNSSDKKYIIDTIASEAGHKVVRLPQYHCHYNPMEFIWVKVKTYITNRNVHKMPELTAACNEALSCITPEDWVDAVKHADLERESDSRLDRVVETYFESYICNVSESSASDDEQSE